MAKHELNHIKKSGQPHCKMFNSCFVRKRNTKIQIHPKNTHNLSTSTYRQTMVETEVRHLKQKDISASVFPDIFFHQVTSTKTCCNIYVDQHKQTCKKKFFQGNLSRKNFVKKCCLQNQSLLSSPKVQSCVPKHKMFFFFFKKR
ncbi:hypothetical protein NC651_007863 [Populus alba x Populus x berolinensis]|nr:hypothetical protein NC651_007863 [Populus alba x Populus x berolinensis]